MLYCFLTMFVFLCDRGFCLDNGLALTPPMGWLAWERFRCNTRCDLDPHNCISETLFMEMADRLAFDGYKDVGYEYINIDDCWMSRQRDKNGDMVADSKRFPRGIKFLADYVHSRGLKLGIYQDFGYFTCMGYPGIIGHMEQDAKKFIEWEVDMVKLDGCNSDPYDMDNGYITMGKYLQKSKRPILYSCSWPYYQLFTSPKEPNYTLISSHCNMWRNYHDIEDSWGSIQSVIDFFGDNQEVISRHIGPGRWSDPDMIMIGNHHLTHGQSRAQMAVWSMIPGPLLMSNDLRNIEPGLKDIILNKRVIAINQDPLGIPGKRVYKEKKLEIWKRSVMPIIKKESSHVILFLNSHHSKRIFVKSSMLELELKNTSWYVVTELFSNDKLGLFQGRETFHFDLAPMDVVMLHFMIIA